MRMNIKEAIKSGLITEKRGAELRRQINEDLKQRSDRLGAPVPSAKPTHTNRNLGDVHSEGSPQLQIYNALNARLPDIAMWEVGGLVPGRAFRADIYLPESRLVIEMDGFQFHRSKEQFQKDREKRSLMVMHGYPVIGVYYAQVKNDLDALIDNLLSSHEFYKPFAEQFFYRALELAVKRSSDRTD